MLQFYFAHVPKTAGTFVKTLLDSNGIQYTYLGHSTDIPPPSPSRIRFGIVRNPWEQKLSQYYHYDPENPTVRGLWGVQASYPTFRDYILYDIKPFEQVVDIQYRHAKVDIIFKSEMMQQVIEFLEKMFGKRLKITDSVNPHINPYRPSIDKYTKEMDETMWKHLSTFCHHFHYRKDGNSSNEWIFYYDFNGNPISYDEFCELHPNFSLKKPI